ncbi:sensor histidine kinase [Promicromonospora sp. NFX87]|uniref:sensor histidine kinase n=1 Tax=Promicromonospora sp. NFX87 TaxID=3402691 RepID=UPI003AFB6A21
MLIAVWRQWPLVVALVVLAVLDLQLARELGTAGQAWVAPAVVVLAGLALLARARPVIAAVGAAAMLVASPVVLRTAGAEMLAGLALTELAALGAVIASVVRQVRPLGAAGLVGLVVATGVAATQLRPRYWSLPEGSLPEPWWSVSLSGAAMALLPTAYGCYLRIRDGDRARASRAAVVAAQHRERLGLARELRDVVAGHVGAMMEQTQAAQELSVTDPGAAARALPAIEGSGMEALAAMRRLVATLRDREQDDGHPAVPQARTTDLAADLRRMTSAGDPPVRLTIDLAEPVGDEVATSVLRVVEESVANARRHAAGAREISASVRAADGRVRIEVTDDGRPGPATRSRRRGSGLVGLRERARLLGGQLHAGPTPGGWRVTAEVPLHLSGR